PVYKAPPPPPVYNWTGCYLGAGGGYGMFNQEVTELTLGGVPTTAVSTGGGRGWFGTVQVGCDYQFNGNWLIGAFADWDFGRLGNDRVSFPGLIGDERQNWSWAVGGRVGYLIAPQFLAFFSAGYSQAHYNDVNLFTLGVPSVFTGFVDQAHTFSGWFL